VVGGRWEKSVPVKSRFVLRLWGRGALILGAAFPSLAAAPEDLDHLPVHQGIGDLPPRLMEVTPEGLSGHPESAGCRLLFEPQEIGEPESFDLLREEVDDILGSPAEGAEAAEGCPIPDPALDPGSASPVAATASASRSSFVHESTIT
jgi:hypothetical protein